MYVYPWCIYTFSAEITDGFKYYESGLFATIKPTTFNKQVKKKKNFAIVRAYNLCPLTWS